MPETIGEGLRALVIEDEDVIRSVVLEVLEGMGFAAGPAVSLADARRKLAEATTDLLVVDKNLPDGSGLLLVKELADKDVDAQVVLMSGYANLSSAVDALQAGVADYIIKPFDLADFRARLQRATEALRLRRANRRLLGELKEKNALLEGLATRDPLTGLDNHASFQESVRREIARAQRRGMPCALLLVSIDKFREVNARLGYAGGDALLQSLGAYLLRSGRASDVPAYLGSSGVMARFGGDTFAILLPETDRTGGASRAEQLRRGLAEAVTGSGLPRVTASVGVAAFPEHAQSPEGLIAAATVALEGAKEAGRNRIISWSRELAAGGRLDAAQVRQEADRLFALASSIRDRAFRPVYQPIFDLAAGTELAWEALSRPLHPAFGSIQDVLAAAERCGQVADLGRVLRELQVASIGRLAAEKLLFLNIHPFEFLVEKSIESESALQPFRKRIVLELTEAAEVSDFARARERVAALRASGFRIAVDDLGSGYSTLNSLALLEPDFVKLDMAMVRGIEGGRRAARLIKHILEYCRGEGMRVVCEGIETEQELGVVRDIGVDLVQGYLFAKPGPDFPPASLPR
ncbi:MAG: EAL domain-containing protein [Deltaproteobacteria bacterium]|nr:MAG: EAL domain-containing protein [Deltaproteobacteria bacterium]